jgi:hypothetical protein
MGCRRHNQRFLSSASPAAFSDGGKRKRFANEVFRRDFIRQNSYSQRGNDYNTHAGTRGDG